MRFAQARPADCAAAVAKFRRSPVRFARARAVDCAEPIAKFRRSSNYLALIPQPLSVALRTAASIDAK
jgi:hypothetical protein